MATEKVTECYSLIDKSQRWQGDVYPRESFLPEVLPTPKIPYWMLVNRTCHLYESSERPIKLPYLNFVAVYPLRDFLTYGKKGTDSSIKSQIKNLIANNEGALFLPASIEFDVETPLVANFNLLYTFGVESTPRPDDKKLQLSSPFSEHAFQKFSRYFYTVGYDDETLRSSEYLKTLVSEFSKA